MRRPGIILPALLAWAALALALPCGAEPDRPHRISAALGDSVQALEDLFDKGQFTEAEARGRQLLAAVEGRYGTESLEAAAVLDPLARAVVAGQYLEGASEAVTMGRRSLGIRERMLGPDHPDVATGLLTLASVTGLMDGRIGGYADTDHLILRAQTIRERALGPDHPLVAACLAMAASKRIELGEFDLARRDLERALRVQEHAYGPEDVRLVPTLTGLSELALTTGDDAIARSLLERVLAIRVRTSGPDSSFVLDALGGLLNLAYTSGDSEEYERLTHRSLSIGERCLDPWNMRLGFARQAQLHLAWKRGEGLQARAMSERWYQEAEQHLGSDHLTTTFYGAQVGSIALVMGDAEAAKEWLGRVSNALQGIFPEDHPFQAIGAHFLGAANLECGDAAEARVHLERSLRIREASLGPGSREVAETLHALSVAHWMLGDEEEAVRIALEMEARTRMSLRAYAESFSERQALRYAATRPNGMARALRYASRAARDTLNPAVWDAVIRSRALILDEMASRLLVRTDDPDVRRRRDELAAARRRVANLMARGPGSSGAERYRVLLEQAQQERETAERALAVRSVPFRMSLARERLGVEQVKKAIPAGAVMISYSLQGAQAHRVAGVAPIGPSAALPELYFAIVARSAGPVQVIDLGEARSIDSLVGLWAAGTSVAPRSGRNAEMLLAGTEVRRRIWDPVAPLVQGASQVFIVPDGSLLRVPFAALPGDAGGYLVESGPVLHYLTAERDLVPDPGPEPDRLEMLAIGGADFDFLPAQSAHGEEGSLSSGSRPSGAPESAPYRGPRPGCPEFHEIRFDPLPGTAREIDEVTRAWPDTAIVRVGREATEARFKAEAPRCGMLHVATHGFMLDADCSEVVTGRGIGRLKPLEPATAAPAPIEASPLLRSGLALTGANRREEADPDGEDGILTSEEIAALDLSSVRWAVLSACNTGRGEIQAGEGVLGLRRAFQIAGAKTLIMSLWPVDDEGTREWMGSLYRARFGRELGTAEAVRAATLETLRARRARGESDHPFYWGAFVAAGDWR